MWFFGVSLCTALLWSKANATPIHDRPDIGELSTSQIRFWAQHGPDIGVSASQMRSWAQYQPFIPVEEYVAPPAGCSVTQVNLIQRHGARWPTSGSGKRYSASVVKLQSAIEFKDSKLDFLKTFVYNFGVDNLLPFGASQSSATGGELFRRYAGLVSETNPPFVRAADSQRVVDTASNWTVGFAEASQNKSIPKIDLIIPETGNVTLDDSMCPSAEDGDAQSEEWIAVFAPNITARLNADAPGANLTDDDVVNIMNMCPFHAIVTEAPSPFCDLFAHEEFKSYEYYNDVDKYYGTGYGNALGPVQGVGYVNELLARLTGKAVQDETQTNRTLDASPVTFPLNRTFYADFSHDNQMVAIYSTMGLFKQTFLPNQTLDPTLPSSDRTWINSNLVPFSARMTVEKVECTTKTQGLSAGTFVRVLVNDAVQPLEFCGGVNGFCALQDFAHSQAYARNNGEGDFEKCFE
ncbi:acid phosphatase [Amylostereum chailletii]|nr:acid phosphatase [Amylostereum chailletii]